MIKKRYLGAALIFSGLALFSNSLSTHAAEVTVDSPEELEATIENATEDMIIKFSSTYPSIVTEQKAIRMPKDDYEIIIDGEDNKGKAKKIEMSVADKKYMWKFEFPEKQRNKLTIKNLHMKGVVDSTTQQADGGIFLGPAPNKPYAAVLGDIKFDNVLAEGIFSNQTSALRSDRLGGSVAITNSTFKNNKKLNYIQADTGTTTSAAEGSAAVMFTSAVVNEEAGADGKVKIENSTFLDNEIFQGGWRQGQGGAVSVRWSGTAAFDFKDNYFKGNKVSMNDHSQYSAIADGGAVALFEMAPGFKANFTGNTFTENTAADDGGAVFIEQHQTSTQPENRVEKTVLFENNTFYRNEVLGKETDGTLPYSNGGAICLFQNASATLSRYEFVVDTIQNTFVENKAHGKNSRGAAFSGSSGNSGWLRWGYSTGRHINDLFVGNESEVGIEEGSKNQQKLKNVSESKLKEVYGGTESIDTSTNLGYDNGTMSTLTIPEVHGIAPFGLVENYNKIQAGSDIDGDRLIIPTVPIAPEKAADNKQELKIDEDQRNLGRKSLVDNGSVEEEWIKYDINDTDTDKGQFKIDPLTFYDGTEYWETEAASGRVKHYYQVGYGDNDMNRKIPDGLKHLKAERDDKKWKFLGWSKDKDAKKPDQGLEAGTKIPVVKNGTILYAIWETGAPINVLHRTYDEEGNLIPVNPGGAGDIDDTILEGQIDDRYVANIPQKDGYTFDGILKDGDPLSGLFTEEEKTVTLIYSKKPVPTGSIIIEYLDDEGHTIADPTVVNGKVGDPAHAAEPKDITGYTYADKYFNSATGSENQEGDGKITIDYIDGVIRVNYIYTKDKTAAGNVTVHYINEKGENVAEPMALPEGSIGDPYTVDYKMIDGYSFSGIRQEDGDAPAHGTYQKDPQDVYLIYKKDPVQKGVLVIQHQDTEGHPILNPSYKTAKVGETYQLDQEAETQPAVDKGYEWKETLGSESGEYAHDVTVVTYVYEKQDGADVTVKYVDEAGHPITGVASETLKGKLDGIYHAEYKTIEGYTFKEVRKKDGDAPAVGSFTKEPQTVTLVYKKDKEEAPKQGLLVVQHEDEQGRPIINASYENQPAGTPYVKEPSQEVLDKDYTFETVKDNNASGTYTEGTTVVTFVYSKNAVVGKPVIVNYLNENEEVIAETETLVGNIGDLYNIEYKTIEGYTFKEVKGQPVGYFTNREQKINVIYKQDPVQTGIVIEQHEDEDGTPLASARLLKDDVGKRYTTSASDAVLKKGYELTGLKDDSAPSNGYYTKDPQVVTYLYKKKAVDPVVGGKVTIHYLDENGEAIEVEAPKEKSGNVGEKFQIDVPVIPGYFVKGVEGPLSGEFTGDPQTVVITYGKVETPVGKGALVVYYEDTDGHPIANAEVYTGKLGTAYDGKPVKKVIKGYSYQTVIGSETGSFGEEVTKITYVYTKDIPEPTTGKVVVNFVDEQNKPLAYQHIMTGTIGDPYTTLPLVISGYEVKEVKGTENGLYAKEGAAVTYVYQKIEAPKGKGTLVVYYQDEDGHPIANAAISNGTIGDSYAGKADKKEINGYTYQRTDGDTQGTYKEDLTVVTHVYKKNPVDPEKEIGKAIVKYVDEDNNQLDYMELTGEIGEAFTTYAKYIAGYELKTAPDPVGGTYTEADQTFVYVYKKAEVPAGKGTLVVYYQDEDGHPIANAAISNGTIGDSYAGKADKKEINGYTYQRTDGDTQGTYKEELTIVTHIYKKEAEPEKQYGKALVKYVDEAGKPGEVLSYLEMSGEVGQPFQTYTKVFPGYELKTAPDPASGTYTAETQEFVYVYKKVEAPAEKGSLTVYYQDKNGIALGDSVTTYGKDGAAYEAKEKAFKGYKLIETKGETKGTYEAGKEAKVIFIYEAEAAPEVKKGTVIVKYVDEKGKEIKKAKTLTDEVGKDYATEAPVIEGYTYDRSKAPKNASGKYEEKEQTVTYVYKKAKTDTTDTSTTDASSSSKDKNSGSGTGTGGSSSGKTNTVTNGGTSGGTSKSYPSSAAAKTTTGASASKTGTSGSSAKDMPKTGEADSRKYVLVGLFLVSAAAGVIWKRKKYEAQ